MAVGMDIGHVPPQPHASIVIVKSNKNNKNTKKKNRKKQKGG
jgi:hypothetical protein